MNKAVAEDLARAYQHSRRDLKSYLTRIVVRPEVAEELVQQAALKLVESAGRPTDPEGTRAWLFRVGTNLAFDHLRRHSTWRETVLEETRERAVNDAAFVAESRLLCGSPEMSAIAREHLAVCLSCTLRSLQPEQAAALLLAEVYGFSVGETAQIIGATGTRVKNLIQAARARLRDKYAATCALITKQGVCHQCLELSGFFNGRAEDPLAGTPRTLDDRLAILRQHHRLGPWHRIMMRIVDDLLATSG
jgi:RNA polymerase sigma-70 factor (ECF subfamily)